LQRAPSLRSKTKTQRFNGLTRDAAVPELLPRSGPSGTGQLFPKIRRRYLVHFQQRFAQPRVASRVIAFDRLGDRDPEFLREHPHGILEPDFLVKLEELEHVAADAAAEAVEKSFFRIDVKRRRLLAVERTESFIGASGALQRDVLLDDRQEVRLKAQIIDK